MLGHHIYNKIIAIGSCDRLDDLILLSNAHALHRALSYYLRLYVYVWTGKNDSNTPRVDANPFKNGEKTSVLKNTRIRVDRALFSIYVLVKRHAGDLYPILKFSSGTREFLIG